MAPSVTVDETEPLLGLGATANLNSTERQSPARVRSGVPVDFDPKGDAENPREWPNGFRWVIILLLFFNAFTVTFNCISVVPIASRIVSDLSSGGLPGKYASVLLVTIWELGESAGPLIIAPLSEMLGRWPVMNATNTLFILATILAASSQSTPVFILARALSGLVVSSNVLNPAVVGDMFDPERRGSPMSLINLAPLMGGAIGPAISGAIAESLSWRWALWIAAILAGAAELCFLVFFRETYKVSILRRRAEKLHLKVGSEKKSGELLESVVRPFIVFKSSGVLVALSLFGSVVFAQFYNVSTTLPNILEDTYGLSPALTGVSLLCFSLGSAISVAACNLTLDRIYARMKAKSPTGAGEPEFRLPLVVVGAFTLPFALAMYGWSAQLRLPVAYVLLSNIFMGVTLMLAFLPLSAYVVDAFGLYSASAMTGLIVSRCLMGTFLPLATAPLVDSLGYGWGFTVVAAVSLVLAPIPVAVMRYGKTWRERGPYTQTE